MQMLIDVLGGVLRVCGWRGVWAVDCCSLLSCPSLSVYVWLIFSRCPFMLCALSTSPVSWSFRAGWMKLNAFVIPLPLCNKVPLCSLSTMVYNLVL